MKNTTKIEQPEGAVELNISFFVADKWQDGYSKLDLRNGKDRRRGERRQGNRRNGERRVMVRRG